LFARVQSQASQQLTVHANGSDKRIAELDKTVQSQ
jgi:hypothetical protein